MNPTYVGLDKDTINYIKVIENGDIIKIPVKPSKNRGIYFMRSMYTIGSDTVKRGLEKGTLKNV